MPVIDSIHTSGLKTASPAVYTFDITFDMTDFNQMVGAATLQGPFALYIDVHSFDTVPLYFGVEIQTIERSITISDRQSLFCIPGTGSSGGAEQVRSFGPSGAPQLAQIDGIVTKITLHFFRLTNGAGTPISAQIRVGPSTYISAALPYIGSDKLALNPSVFNRQYVVSGVANGVNNQLVCTTGVIPTALRLRVIYVEIYISATAALGTAFTQFQIGLLGTFQTVALVDSLTNAANILHFEPQDLYLPGVYEARIITSNNSGAPQTAVGSIFSEVSL